MGRAYHRKRISVEHPHTRGTGIRYVERRPPVARELTPAELAEREKAKAALKASRGVREWNIFALDTFSGLTLDAWEDVILAKKNVDRYLPTEKAVDRAMQMVRNAVGKHCDQNGVEVDRLLQSLERRRSTIPPNGCLNEALTFLITRLSEALEKVLNEQGRVEQ
jgi:hypothetical protein